MANNYNFENLILLVGTNPLPNYVVAKYFLINNQNLKKIWLVHSEKQNDNAGTKEIAERIKDVIEKEQPAVKFDYCALADIGDARTIKYDIERIILPKIDSVHFNYTGGTKAMAVHVYRAIERAENIRDRSFSYLDARKFVLIDDKGIVSEDLRKFINDKSGTFSFETLMKLHGYEKVKVEQNYPWDAALNEFKKIIDEGKLKNYLDWKKDIIRKIYYNEYGVNLKVLEARKNICRWSCKFDEHQFKNDALVILTKIPPQFSILNNAGNIWIPEDSVNDKMYKSRIKPSIEFLDGKWLENYVFRVLEKSLNEQIPIELNWKLRKQNNGKDFELDLILLKGYQIFGISITTDHKEGTCKLKGFEILHRVNQIGGEEAKAILITCLSHNKNKEPEQLILADQVESLRKDLKLETGGNEKLLVLGIEDLTENKLLSKIKDYVGI